MKLLLISLLSSFLFSALTWETDFEKARQKAASEKKLILLNFSGSDWCGPCIRMHREIFETEVFEKFATKNLVLLNADFPRLKKNQLPKEQQTKNEQLAETYNKDGAFPFTLLLNAEGKVLKKWDGLPKGSAEDFTKQVNSIILGNN